MNRPDIVLINPGDRKQVYQDLGLDLAAVEPPFWISVIAGFLRKNGCHVEVIDSNAENISPEETAERIKYMNPLIAGIIVYGSQPSASTQNMTIAGRIATEIKNNTGVKVAMGGLHPSALPERTLQEEDVDYVIDGEGPYTVLSLVDYLKNGGNISNVPGLWYLEGGNVKCTPRAQLITDLGEDLIPAWDLFHMDLYRAHNWHCFDDIGNREPYGVLYTSLGCPYNCLFCCINAPFGKPGIRYRHPDAVLAEIDDMVNRYGIKNIKIPDELFVLKESHYMTIVNRIIERGYDLNFWVYARVDTVKEDNLERMKKAGINWFALGIESANPDVRDGATKRMRENDILKVVRQIRDHGIRVIGNYIFGLPDDTAGTMRETLDLAKELNCEFGNFYSAMAYPGSQLYNIAVHEKWELPEKWHGFSQHSYETLPLPTKYLTAAEVLKFRDDAFHEYFENPSYLEMVKKTFGQDVYEHVKGMSVRRLKRKILGQ